MDVEEAFCCCDQLPNRIEVEEDLCSVLNTSVQVGYGLLTHFDGRLPTLVAMYIT